jgi:hypothetical protein
MNWNRIREGWRQFVLRVRLRGAGQARKKQVADWIAREHKADPIHK